MLKKKSSILAATVLASVPVIASAATITYSYDLNDILISPTKTGFVGIGTVTGASITGTSAAPIVTVPSGYFVEVGIDATVTNNNGLGISQFTLGMNDSNPSVAGVFASGSSNASGTALVGTTVNPHFSFLPYGGQSDGAGGVLPTFGTAGGYVSSTGDSQANYAYGVGTPGNLFSTMRIGTTSGGTAKFTPITYAAGTQYLVLSKGAVGSSSAQYKSTAFSANDSFGPMPVLTIISVGAGATTSSSSSSAQPIISLLSTAPTTYASQLGSTIALTYTGPGGYVPGSTTFSASNKGYGVVTGFHSPDTEIYALDVLNSSGGALTSAQITAVISDINAQGSGVTASLVTGIYAHLFPGYDVLLTSTGTPPYGTDYLGIDFSATGDTDTATQGFTVGAIAAVPEPATMAGVVLGASGLLLRRRQTKAA